MADVEALITENRQLAIHLRDYEPGEWDTELEKGWDEAADLLDRNADALEQSRPRVVETVEQLEVLPDDSVIRDVMNDVGVIHHGNVWYPETNPIELSKVAKHYLPATVLYTPEEATK